MARATKRDLDAIVTTEKDAVRFPKIKGFKIPIMFLRVEIQILNGQETWQQCVQRICRPHHIAPAERQLFTV